MAKAKPTIEEIRAKVIGRSFAHVQQLERAEGEITDRTLPIAITSDREILHWFGYLKLNHAPECIRMDRMNAGAPLLLEHNRSLKIGGLMNARSDGHVLRADAKFSRRPEADAELMDIEDGIGRGVSGGFAVHHLKLVEEREDDHDLYQCDEWTPFEGSLVSLAADISVGVGRELEMFQRADDPADPADPGDPGDQASRADAPEPQPEPEPERARPAEPSDSPTTIEVRTSTMDKDKELIAIGELFGEVEMAREFALTDKSPAELKAAILAKRQAAQPPAPKPLVELSEREVKVYSITRAILADVAMRKKQDVQCFELDVSQEIERKLDASIKRHGGIFVPTLIKREHLQRAGLDTQTSTKGAEGVFTEYGGFIDLLRNRSIVMAMGATVLPGLQGNVSFPRQVGAGTASWVAENPGSDVADSELTLDQITLSPKTLQSTTAYSRQLLAQSVFNVDSLVQSDLAKINALAVDLAAIHGTGSTNQPLGLYNITGVNSVAFGGAISYDKVIDLETEVATDNADIGTMAYLTTVGARGKAKKTQEFSGTNGMALWRDGEMNGYRAEASNQISKVMSGSAATGGSEHGILFGVWAELLIGEWAAMELITDPYRLKKQAMIEVTSFLMVDIEARYAQAFAKGTGQTV